MHIRLHIESLILEGFPAPDRAAIAAAVEAELGRLITERGLPSGFAGGGAIPTLDAGSFALAPDTRPQQIGAQVAQSLYGSLSR